MKKLPNSVEKRFTQILESQKNPGLFQKTLSTITKARVASKGSLASIWARQGRTKALERLRKEKEKKGQQTTSDDSQPYTKTGDVGFGQ